MDIQDINELANDVAVSRLMIKDYEEQIQNLPGYNELISNIESEKIAKDVAQSKLIEAMQGNQLKSWKTEQANFALATRYSVTTDPIFKKNIERKLKEGDEVEGYELSKKEYLSIRKVK